MRDAMDTRLRQDGAVFRGETRTSRGTSYRRVLAPLAAAALVVVAVSASVLSLPSSDRDRPDVLGAPAGRETADLSAPDLVASGTLRGEPVYSVRSFAVPFTFSNPARSAEDPSWSYMVGETFELGNIVSGLTVLAPTQTYDPTSTWQGQRTLVTAPVDAAGWERWLEQTGHVDITRRQQVVVGGAPATRFTVEAEDLPAAYDGCGGGRRCLAITPFADPAVGAARVGSGPQAGIDRDTREMTVIELEDRAVLVLTTAKPGAGDTWLPALRAVIDSLRFA